MAYPVDEQLALRNVHLLAEMYAPGTEQEIDAYGMRATRAILSLPTVHSTIGAVARALLRQETLASDEVIALIVAATAPNDVRRARRTIEATCEGLGGSW